MSKSSYLFPLIFLGLSFLSGCHQKKNPKRLNVLFIIDDDLNGMINPLGYASISTPNLDRLASQSTVFTHAYDPAPACGPSRASLLSGILPSTSGAYYNSQLNKHGSSILRKSIVLPQYFKNHDFLTGMYGKIFHEIDRNNSLSRYCTSGYYAPHLGFWENIPDTSVVPLTDFRYEGGSNFAWGAVPDKWQKEHKLIDTQNADKVINVLKQPHDRPFFLALGLLRPHLPWIVPQKYFDKYPLDSIAMPKGFKTDDLDDVPEAAKWMAWEVPGQQLGKSNLQTVITSKGKWKSAIRAYKASVSYMDHQLGRVLDALKNSPYAGNTIVIFCGDNGYMLGQKDHWTKFALWEESNRVPIMISVPGGHHQISRTPVSLLDLYPTIVSLENMESPKTHQLQGVNLSHLLKNPDEKRGKSVLSMYGYECYSLRNGRYRYIRYRNGNEELYDHKKDPYEWNNLATNLAYASVKKKLKNKLPKINTPESGHGGNLGWDPKIFKEEYIYKK